MSKPRKYYTVLLIEERLPLINSAGAQPVQHCAVFGTVCGTTNTMFTVYIQLECLSVSSNANLSLPCQTC